jgi:hypothetical protein
MRELMRGSDEAPSLSATANPAPGQVHEIENRKPVDTAHFDRFPI